VDNSFASRHNGERALVVAPDAGPVFVSGNRGAGPDGGTAPEPWPVPAVTAESAAEALPRVLAGAGAWPRDEVDARLVSRAQEAHR
jgi:hypothetical protein